MTGISKESNTKRNIITRLLTISVMFVVMLTIGLAAPGEVHAASKKAKYSVKVHNINSNTVMKKGSKLKISYTATKKKNGKKSSAKVKFKSSNKKVATVSKRGVIKAKKKGTVKITVYCKAKKSKKKTVKIKVGTPVSSISVSGYRHLRVGRSNTLKAKANSGATNKSVSWWSDNPAVAKVSSSGKVTAKAEGAATIYATAKDGSGVYGTRTVYVHQYRADETKWIAHRGLHTSYIENTANAFSAAAQTPGFWGIECDIYETRYVSPQMPALPELPSAEGDASQSGEDADDGDEGDSEEPSIDGYEEQIAALKTQIEALPQIPSGSELSLYDKCAETKDAWSSYVGLSEEMTDPQKSLVREALNTEGEDLLNKLFEEYRLVMEYESIDFAINHDTTFTSIWGNGNYVRNMSRAEIEAQLPGVCFLDEYLRICGNKVPVIEFKDSQMSERAVKKAVDMICENYSKTGVGPYLISFYYNVLANAKREADNKLGGDGRSKTYFLFSENWSSGVETARSCRFTGVSVTKSLLDDCYSTAKSYGLGVGTWTYRDNAADDDYLYDHLLTGKYQLDFATVDYKIFN